MKFTKAEINQIDNYINSQQQKHPHCIIQYGTGCNKPNICIKEDFTTIIVSTHPTEMSCISNYEPSEHKVFYKHQ